MKFEIESDEGLAIRGHVESPDRPKALVVIVHGWKGFAGWGFFPWMSEQLVDNGFAACRFDLSRNGIGEDGETFSRLDLFADDTYSAQVADLHAVVRHCRTLHPRLPLFLVGHSRGGAVALLGAARIDSLRGVVTWSGIARADRWDAATKARWRRDGFMDIENARTKQTMRMSTRLLDDYDANAQSLDVLAAVRRLKVPLLAIHGGRDESVPVGEGREIASRNDLASLLVIGSATHTYNAIHPLIHVPTALQLAMTVTTRFVGAWISG